MYYLFLHNEIQFMRWEAPTCLFMRQKLFNLSGIADRKVWEKENWKENVQD